MRTNLEGKKILVVGASGRVGKKVVEYCLNSNAQVRAFVRSPEKFDISDGNLEIFKGDVTISSHIDEALNDREIVFSTLSGRSTKPDYSVLTIGIQNLIQGMQKKSIKRILNVAGAGILQDEIYGLRRDRPNYPIFFRMVSAENLKVLSILENSNLDWTTICAPEMPEGERTSHYRTKIDFLPENGNRISVEDVADFLVNQCFNSDFYCKKIGIAY